MVPGSQHDPPQDAASGSGAAEPQDSSFPVQLGPLKLLNRLGRGGMGTVYEAEAEGSTGTVAVKLLGQLTPTQQRDVRDEFRAAALLSHPNLVQHYRLYEHEGAFYFTMEQIHGVSLDDWLAQDPARRVDLVPVFQQIASGLHYLHRHGRLHLDLKPQNVLVEPGGRVVLVDFGLSLRTNADGEATSRGVRGTPAYMAPEQWDADLLTEATDWYSVGALLADCLGLDPLKTDPKLARQHHSAPNTSPQLAQLSQRLRQHEPRRRPSAPDVFATLGLDPSPHRTHPPWVGRAQELDTLEEALAHAGRVRPTLVLVRGEPGAGRSALVRTFQRTHPHPLWLTGQCHAQEFVPYRGVEEALSEVIQPRSALVRAHSPASAAQSMFTDVHELLHRPPNTFDDWASYPTLKPTLDTRDHAEPQQLRHTAWSDLVDRLRAHRGDRTVVLALDDVQWSDADAGSLVRFLLSAQPHLPLMVIATCPSRDEGASSFLRAILGDAVDDALPWDTVRIDLGPLRPEEASQLADALALPRTQGLDAAGGNPHLIHQLARGDGQHPSQMRDPTSRAERLLHLLDVAGYPLEIDLCAITLGGEPLDRLVFSLRNQGLIDLDDSVKPPRLRLRYRSANANNDATLPKAERADLHRELAHHLHELGRGTPQRLAQHLLGAQEHTKALPHAVRAAELAETKLAFLQAAELWRLAASCLDAEPEARLFFYRQAAALIHAGHTTDAAPILEQLAASWPEAEAELRQTAGECLLSAGHVERGIRVLRPLMGPTRRQRLLPPAALRIARLIPIAWRVYRAGATPLLPLSAQAPPPRRTQADLWWVIGKGLVNITPDAGIDAMLKSADAALATGDPIATARVLAFVGAGMQTLGGPATYLGRQWLSNAERIAQHHKDDSLRGGVSIWRALEHVFAGRWAQAAKIADDGLALASRGFGMSWERTAGGTFSLLAREQLGAFRTVHERANREFEAAHGRGDLYAQTVFRQFAGFADLAAGRLESTRRAIAWVDQHWQVPHYTVQHFYNARLSAYLHLATGDLREAAAVLSTLRGPIKRSRLLDAPMSRIEYHLLEARVALACEAHQADPRALHRAQLHIKALEREARPDAVLHARLLRGVMLGLQGREAPPGGLDRVQAGFEHLGMRAMAATTGLTAAQGQGADVARQTLSDCGIPDADLWLRIVSPHRRATPSSP